MKLLQDDSLIRRAAAQDAAAFEQLMLLHQKPVYNICWRMAGNAEDALDLSQEVFLKLEAIRNAMNALPVDFREILELRVVRQLPYEQIAQIMDLPVGTVKSRLARARLQLKKRLDAGNFFETGASKRSE